MAKRKISLKAIKQDLQDGIDDAGLMEKYGLSSKQLQQVFDKGVAAGGFTREQIDARGAAGREQDAPPVRPAPKAPKTPPAKPKAASKAEPKPPEAVPATPRPRAKKPAVEAKIPAAVEPTAPEPEVLPPVEEEIFEEKPRRRFPLFTILFIVCAVAFVLAVKFLPWWASVALVIVLPILGIFIAKRAIMSFFTKGFKAKGKALANATAQVHEIRRAGPPDDEDDEYLEELYGGKNLRWFHIDLTITPQAQSEGFAHWEPGELQLAKLDAKPNDLEDEEDEVAFMAGLKVYIDGRFQEDEGMKYGGPVRIELHVGVVPGVDALQFRYYFELFGRVELPGGASGAG